MKTSSYMTTVRSNLAFVLMAAAGLTLLTGNTMVEADVGRDSITRVETFTYEVDGRSVVLGNLAGEVTLSPAQGDDIEIRATVVAGGKDAEEALKLITFEDETSGNRLKLHTVYPVDDYDRFIYRSSAWGNSQSTLRYQGERVKVGSGRGLRGGLEVHVDYDIQLPRDVSFSMINGVGAITAVGVDGDILLKSSSGSVSTNETSGSLTLDTGSGRITGVEHSGDLSADSGSGRVKVRDVTGDVSADTGSGSITAENVGGRLFADTGSGGVTGTNIGGEARVDTGSGRVSLDNVSGSINVDTGSGSIDIDNWMGGEEIELDTGSGSVSASGNFASVERMRVDTGSGSVSLVSTAVPNMKLDVSSRDIDVDFPDMTVVKKSRSSFRGTIGAGTGSGEIDTGSGSVSFRMGGL